MASIPLVFGRSPVTAQPVRLIFGETDAPPAPGAVTLAGGGQITGLRLRVAARAAVQAQGQGTVTGFRLRIASRFDINVSRPTVGQLGAGYQQAQPLKVGAAGTYQQALPATSGTRAHWQAAQQLQEFLQATWQESERLATWARGAYQQAIAVPVVPLQQQYQEAAPLRTGGVFRFQEARSLPTQGLTARFQEALRLRSGGVQRFQAAQPFWAAVSASAGYALQTGAALGARYQQAWPPRPGRTVLVPPSPPGPVPCYLPTLPARLIFTDPADSTQPVRLVFRCDNAGPGPDPEPGATVTVPVRRVYMVLNNVSLTRADGVPIPSYALALSLNADSWTWQWSATLHASALPLIKPGSNGEPVEVVASINGAPYRLTVEDYSRQRQFGQTRIAVKGRGRAALLDAPYAPVQNHGNAADRTAQQLMADVLTMNGVGIGWDVDWQLTDWLVPGGAWSHQGSYISALLDIARAAGGYVQPHDTAATLRVLPRYPAAPWNWHTLTPDFELPSAVVSVEGIDWQRRAAYDRIYVSGANSAGVLGQVTRGGTAGALAAPMVTHPLITHADAARQRGLAELSDTGPQAHISLRLPVLPETGVIKPGALVRYVDGGDTHLGLVRSLALDWSSPTLRQTLSVETHPA